MHENPVVSIVIPVFNVEKYLRQCLESVVRQTLHDVEIICVNDGSTDGSLAILQEFAERDPRIVVIDKANSGYGDSVNCGIEKSAAKWLGIVESDDWIEADMFSRLWKIAETHDADFVKCDHWNFCNDEKEPSLRFCKCKFPFERPLDWRKFQMTADYSVANPPWNALYKKKFLDENGIRFLPTMGAAYHDMSFGFKVFVTAKRAFFSRRKLYNYRIDNLAASSRNYEKKWRSFFDETAEAERYIIANGLRDFVPLAQVWKLQNYKWLEKKLTSENVRKDFWQKMSQAFFEQAKRGEVDKSLFVGADLRDIAILTTQPQFFAFYRENVEPLFQAEIAEEKQKAAFKIARAINFLPQFVAKMFSLFREGTLFDATFRAKKYLKKILHRR